MSNEKQEIQELRNEDSKHFKISKDEMKGLNLDASKVKHFKENPIFTKSNAFTWRFFCSRIDGTILGSDGLIQNFVPTLTYEKKLDRMRMKLDKHTTGRYEMFHEEGSCTHLTFNWVDSDVSAQIFYSDNHHPFGFLIIKKQLETSLEYSIYTIFTFSIFRRKMWMDVAELFSGCFPFAEEIFTGYPSVNPLFPYPEFMLKVRRNLFTFLFIIKDISFAMVNGIPAIYTQYRTEAEIVDDKGKDYRIASRVSVFGHTSYASHLQKAVLIYMNSRTFGMVDTSEIWEARSSFLPLRGTWTKFYEESSRADHYFEYMRYSDMMCRLFDFPRDRNQPVQTRIEERKFSSLHKEFCKCADPLLSISQCKAFDEMGAKDAVNSIRHGRLVDIGSPALPISDVSAIPHSFFKTKRKGRLLFKGASSGIYDRFGVRGSETDLGCSFV